MTNLWTSKFLYSADNLFETFDNPNEYTERVLLLRLRTGEIINESILAHEVNRTLYISATDLLESMGFETVFSEAKFEFNAQTSNPNLDIKITWPSCVITVNSVKDYFNCYNLKFYEGEIFISKEFLENYFKLEISYLPYKSELQIYSERSYPKLDKILRGKKKIEKSTSFEFDPGFESKHAKEQTLKNFFIDQQFSAQAKSQGEDRLEYYTNAVTDINNHEVQITTQGDLKNNDFTTFLIRRDFYGLKKDPYISTYQAGNVVIPSAELIGGPTGRLGFYVSNRPQQQLTTKKLYDFSVVFVLLGWICRHFRM